MVIELELGSLRVTYSLVKGGLGLVLFSIVDIPCLGGILRNYSFSFCCDCRRGSPSCPSACDASLG